MLTKGMYADPWPRIQQEEMRFGLRYGQIRGRELFHNAGWYNRAGEKLGYGDLGLEDINRIKAELEPGEIFIILGESDSFWNFVTELRFLGDMCTTDATEEAPGVEYVCEKARAFITPGSLFLVDRYRDQRGEEDHSIFGPVIWCPRQDVAALIKGDK